MKKSIVFLLIIALVFSLVGCAPQEEEIIFENKPGSTPVPTPEAGSTPSGGEQTSTETPDPTPQAPSVSDTPVTEQPDTPVASPEPEGNGTEENTPPAPEKDKSVVDVMTDLRYFGRTYESGGLRYFNWVGSGFEFTFNGTGAEATFYAGYSGTENIPFIKIYVDGKEQAKAVAVTDDVQTVTLCKGLKKGTHTVRVVKRTNSRSGTLTVGDITMTKGSEIAAPPAAPAKRIEFIGDSITVGYGILAKAGQTEWSTAVDDGTKTYAYLTAEALGAQGHYVAVSGRGLAHNTGGTTEKLMPEMYLETDAYNLAGSKWNFGSWQPQVIVVNLGTNDHNTSSAGEVQSAVTSFLKSLRKNNPDAYIIYAYGMMGKNHESAIKAGISAAGDSKVSYLSLETATTRIMGHPDAVSHKRNAELLTKEIKRITKW